MKVRHYCRKCGEELSTENVSPGYKYMCPNCDEDMYGIEADDRYFPHKKGNKVFVVDMYVNLCKSRKVEAETQDEAERIARDWLEDKLLGCIGAETGEVLGILGFEDAEEKEFRVSGEADENGEIKYY